MAEAARDDEDADTPGKDDPDVGADWLFMNRSRIPLTMDVTGWYSAKARTGPGIVFGGHESEQPALGDSNS